MNYLELSTSSGTVYVAKEPLHWLWVFDEDRGSFDVQVVFKSGEILDLPFDSEEKRQAAVKILIDLFLLF